MCSRHRPVAGADSEYEPMTTLSAQWAYARVASFMEFIADLPADMQLKMIRGYVGRLADPEQARELGRLS